MDCLAFFRAVLPSRGWYCLFTLPDKKHYWYDTLEGLASAVQKFDAAGTTVYHACSSYKEKGSRKQDAVAFVRSAWMDIDCGADKPYKTLLEGGQALARFVADNGLPQPFVVNSGGGLHAYWPYDEDIPAAAGAVVARNLKALAINKGFGIDPTRTADLASVLRPVGSTNRKYTPPAVVAALNNPTPGSFNALHDAVPAPKKPRQERKEWDTNKDFLPQATNVPVSAESIAAKCAQLRLVKDTAGSVPEPLWYSAIELLWHCEQNVEVIHAWSKGHPDYSEEQTNAKIEQVKSLGPTTCATFEGRNPAGCVGCPYKGKITSPIQLGRVYEPAAGPAAEVGGDADDDALDFVEAPHPFRRTTKGIIYTNDDGLDVPVYPYDIYVSDLAFDPTANYMVATVQHHLPQEGWVSFNFRAANVASLKDFEVTMRDNNVMPRNGKLMQYYIGAYMAAVQEKRRAKVLYNRMGWHDDGSFIMGDRRYAKDGTTKIGLSINIAHLAPAFEPIGELEPWVEQTRLFDREGMEAHTLMFATGAGAPLMRFSGFGATVLNGLGESNAGKTSMGRFMLSMYGDFERLYLKARDTPMSQLNRIGMLSSLPAYVEETTNADHQGISDFCYEVTQSRSKLRLDQKGNERPTREWSTLVLSSANSSLSDKLGAAKANPEAERLRLFEFPVDATSSFEGPVTEGLFWTVRRNYGLAGARYIEYVVRHQDEVAELVQKTIKQLAKASNAAPRERMWMAGLGCCLAGQQIMLGLGLVRYDVRRFARWVAQQVKEQRKEVSEGKLTALDLLGMYLNDHAGDRLVVREAGYTANGPMGYVVQVAPRGELHIRVDTTHEHAFIEQAHLRQWCIDKRVDYRKMKKELLAERIMLGETRKTLGRGTEYAGGAVLVIDVDMRHPALGNTAVMAVPKEPKPDKAQRIV